jgi:dihydrolipoamide dehydrogenase
MKKNVVIIGAGMAGVRLCLFLNLKHFNVTLIEKDKLGGTCLNSGCIPAKSYYHKSFEKMTFSDVQKKTNDFITKLGSVNKKKLVQMGINYIEEEVSIISKKSVLLSSNKKVNYDYLVLANGSSVYVPNSFCNLDYSTTDDIFSLKKLPKKLVIVGGGYVGCEFASIFSKLGSKVSLIEIRENILLNIAPDLRSELLDKFKKNNIDVYTGKPITEIKNKVITISNKKIKYDQLLICTGRLPNKIDSEFEIKFKKNSQFNTNNSNIFMIGDCKGEQMFAYTAEDDAQNLAYYLNFLKIKKNIQKIPFIIFTNPTISYIGDETKNSIKLDFTELGKFYCDDSTEGFIELFFNEKNIICGAKIINKHAIELISVLNVMIAKKVTSFEMSDFVYGHPVAEEILKLAAKYYNYKKL